MLHCDRNHCWAWQQNQVWWGFTSLLQLLEGAEDMANLWAACAAPA